MPANVDRIVDRAVANAAAQSTPAQSASGRNRQPAFTDVAGADLLGVSRQQGLEGVVAKRLTSRYEPGRRSPAWRKIKVRHRQEAVVGGWTRGEGNRAGLLGSIAAACTASYSVALVFGGSAS